MISMDISQLAAKQKRILEWRDFLETSSLSPKLAEQISSTLEVYAKILVDCWKKGGVSTDAAAQLAHTERELEMLNESVRLNAPRTLPRELDK